MSMIEDFAHYLDSSSAVKLFDKIQKSLGDNRELASKECNISKKSTYDWGELKGDLKYDTKIKILEKAIEQFPVETFHFLTQNLYDASTETLMAALSTIYEQSFDSNDSSEFKHHVNEFEIMTKQYSGLIYKHRDLEINHMFSKLKNHAKDNNYDWKPEQTILYDYETVKKLVPKIISSYIFHNFPQSAEDVSSRENLPLDLVNDIYGELGNQLSSNHSTEESSQRWYVGFDRNPLPPMTTSSNARNRHVGEAT